MKKEWLLIIGFALIVSIIPLLTGLTRVEVMLMIIIVNQTYSNSK